MLQERPCGEGTHPGTLRRNNALTIGQRGRTLRAIHVLRSMPGGRGLDKGENEERTQVDFVKVIFNHTLIPAPYVGSAGL